MRNGLPIKIILLIMLAFAVALIVVSLSRGLSASSDAAVKPSSFFTQFITAGGPIVWFVLLPMSLAAVFLVFEHCLTIRRKILLPVGIGDHVVGAIDQFGPAQLPTHLAGRNDFVSTAITKALTAGRADWIRIKSTTAESLQDQAWTLMRKIEWLSLIGNVAPMVGLFGTVFGMIKLFNAIVVAGGQPQPAHLASGISVALVTTFWGLFTAIPALAAHGVFRNRIETLVSQAVEETEKIMPHLTSVLKQQAKADPQGRRKQTLPVPEITASPQSTSAVH